MVLTVSMAGLMLVGGCGSGVDKVDWEVKACKDAGPYFDAIREFSASSFDADQAVEQLVQMMRDGGEEFKTGLEASGLDVTVEPSSEEKVSWYDLSDAERVDFRRGATTAAEGKDCG